VKRGEVLRTSKLTKVILAWLVLFAGLSPALAAASTGVVVEGSWPFDESQAFSRQRDRIRDQALAEAIDKACGAEVSREQMLWADEMERRFLSRTRIRSQGKVIAQRWLLVPDSARIDATRKIPWKLSAEVACTEARPPTFTLDATLVTKAPPGGPEGPMLRAGDTVALAIRASTTARAMVFALGADRRVVQIVPSKAAPRLDLPADKDVALPGPGHAFELVLSPPAAEGTWHEMLKVVAFKGDNLPAPPLKPDATDSLEPEAFDRWLLETPEDIREESTVVYRLAR